MTSGGGTCQIPKLDPFHHDAMGYMEELGDLSCVTKRRATLSGGVLNITGTDVTYSAYRYIIRPEEDDFAFMMSRPIVITSRLFPVSHEYIELTLLLSDQTEQKEYLMQVVPNQDILSRDSPPLELDLNFLIIAIDSVSNSQAQRQLSKTYNYIRSVLGGYIFMGHSVVGDGTTEQIAALLTGKGEREYRESRRGKINAEPVDDWNWIFKKAKAKGYVTSYCEDSPHFGSFQYRLLGFQDPPTDYYPRSFFLAAEESSSNLHCYGSHKIYNYHLDLANKIYEQYPKQRKFLLHFASEISHNKFNVPGMFDKDLLQFLTSFKEKGYLKNTVLILFGDHGLRTSDFRQTLQGKLEERLPLFTMTFPKWFKERYPKAAKNLQANTKRLTTWYDLHATFEHILEYGNKQEKSKHGISLLTKVPPTRSCNDASIPLHWCPCLQWSAVDHRHVHMQEGALEAINHINNLIFHVPLSAKKCSKLSLAKIIRAEVETASPQVLRFAQSGKDGYEPEYSDDEVQPKGRCRYQITFRTLPNHGIFEATVHYVSGKFVVKGGISRINKYGDQPKCIAKSIPHLREYCYCKEVQ
ncbi:uncharacterized protein LOC114527863 [Dendronephthya gigantea]|uniref:uncharacterized protein LOC114527863 n=1 Tax=Dendronephthya gigantea TaxID=151771 RepID=UPI00106CDBF8|nr:uncharacterized protein LOC114527863 [Dendronephthya gigantea]